MPVNRKFFGSPNGEGNLSVDENGQITLRSQNNNIAVTPDGTAIDNPMLQTISTKKVMMQETPFGLNMIPTIPSHIPTIPFAEMLPTLAVVATAAAALATINFAANKANDS
jgi:hypothetical protein